MPETLRGCLYGDQYIGYPIKFGLTIYRVFALSIKISPTCLYETGDISPDRSIVLKRRYIG